MPDLKRKPAHARTNFDDRLSAAAAARQALLERFRARPSPDDPAEIERQAALKAIADARDARAAERKAAKQAEAARIAEAEAARKAQQEAAAKEARARAADQEAVRKAARDAKYAARKARK
ncbi:MAG TPA: DUF6481 family protein [Rhodopila sp.]|jgi:hypothetical protein